MAKVFIEDYPHGPGGHCSSTALRDLLKFYGHDFTEDMVFGLGVGIGFIYYSHPDMKPPVYIVGRAHNMEEQLCSQLGIGLEVVSGLGPEEGWLAVKRMLDSGIPTMVHADVYYLDYLRAKTHFSAHRIMLVGYDEEKGVAFIADNDRDEIQECSLQNLATARSSAYLPQPAENAYYLFEMPERLTALEEAIPTALDKAVRSNLRLEPEQEVVDLGGARIVAGVKGLEEFASVMDRWPGEMDRETLSLLCKTIYVTAEKGGTGYGGNFRRMYGRFLKEAAPLVGRPGLSGVGEDFTAVGDLWTRLSLTFKDLSQDGAKAVEEASPIAHEIQGREVAAFTTLEDIVKLLLEGA
jgi:hypothetical protein